MKKPAGCHPNRVARVNGLCRSCYSKYIYETRPASAEKARERSRKWREANLEKAKRNDAEKMLRKKYGIGLSEYERIFALQNGLCRLCQKPETTRARTNTEQRLAVDHCHKSGAIRGLLCFKCNTALGQIEANGLLIAISNYLKA